MSPFDETDATAGSPDPFFAHTPGAAIAARRQAAVLALAEGVTTGAGAAVDELHVAAALESRGVTDQIARARYGYDDVFALATDVAAAMAAPEPLPDPDGAAGPHRERASALSTLAHGPLYLVPSAMYPASWAVLGQHQLVVAMVTATALAWIWGMATSAVGYQLRGLDRDRAAGRAQRALAVAGVGASVAVAVLLWVTGVVGPGVIVFVATQTAFQLGAGILVVHRGEALLGLAVLPALAAGLAYVVSGAAAGLVVPALVAAVASGALTFGAGWYACGVAKGQPRLGAELRLRAGLGAAPSVGYAVVCACLVLGTDVRYSTSGLDLALAAAPLVLGMGVVEWRALRFVTEAGRLLDTHDDLAGFRRDLWALLCRELATCLVVLGALGGVLLLVLLRAGRLTAAGALLLDAHVLLGGVFFLGYVLARHRQFPWVLAALAAAVTGYLVVLFTLAGRLEPLGEVIVFTVATVGIGALLVAAFAVAARRFHYFYW